MPAHVIINNNKVSVLVQTDLFYGVVGEDWNYVYINVSVKNCIFNFQLFAIYFTGTTIGLILSGLLLCSIPMHENFKAILLVKEGLYFCVVFFFNEELLQIFNRNFHGNTFNLPPVVQMRNR